MQDHSQTLQAVTECIRQSPQSGGALILYALMEVMVCGGNRGEEWVQAMLQMDELVRGSGQNR